MMGECDDLNPALDIDKEEITVTEINLNDNAFAGIVKNENEANKKILKIRPSQKKVKIKKAARKTKPHPSMLEHMDHIRL